ncbi:UNVERIFIED_CONTAM: Retrovirus-related Pol polyprotein from transposon TNT 1-94 [Sesamum latifolium]|uniref:Retrovirus-related Pol polyprotein from transposon TNT 1-94 n=1 Tax=Sesamum latifolium TaxID=2727402 RepID=A0AAW2SGL4_9LAMI
MEGLLTDSETESSDLDWYTGEEFALQRGRTLLPLTKGFTLKEGIDYTETFSPVSNKDSLRIIMALVAHFYLELHQMDVKTAFLNGDLQEEVYMDQLFGFSQEGSEHLVCRLRKSIYGRVFPSVVPKIPLVLYVDDILLASSDLGLLHDTKAFLIRNFEMKDMGEPHMSWALRFTWPLFSSTAAILEYQIESKISLSYVGSPFAGCDYRILYAELAGPIWLIPIKICQHKHKTAKKIRYPRIGFMHRRNRRPKQVRATLGLGNPPK